MDKSRAIIFGMGIRKELKPLLSYRPSLLLNIADKPIIFHIIEKLIQQGLDTFDLVLHHFPEQIEERLGNGSRWGIKINYHLAKNAETPLTAIIPTVKDWETENILLGVGDSLPQLPVKGSSPVFYNYSANDWSGWSLLTTQQVIKIPSKTPYESIPSVFSDFSAVGVKPFLSARNFHELKESNKKFLLQEKNSVLFPTTTHKVEPGVWISRAVIIEPGVKVIPPILIGENTHIKSGARIGPNAIIENHCIIDNNSTIENSVICQNSYVGETLEIQNCIVDRNALINLSLGTQLNITEEFLISESTPPSIQQFFQKFVEKTIALMLLVTFAPLYLVMRALYPIKSDKVLALPSQEDPGQWRTFELYSFDGPLSWLPMLWNILKGELSFVGTPPRSVEDTEQLPTEWQKLYLKTKPGFITLCDITHGNHASDDDKYASEAYYATQMSALFDIKLVFKWLV